MNENELKRIIEEISSFEQLNLSTIPDINLYMDQVTTFIDEKLSYLKRNEKDSILTKTMINNYTKAGIVLPPKRKKYSKQHMILIILTYYLKQVLSIGDIQSLLSPIVRSITSGENYEKDLEGIYNKFLEIEKEEILSFKDSFEDKINTELEESCKGESKEEFKEEINEDAIEESNLMESEDKDISKLIMTVVTLVVRASIQKRMAEKIIDELLNGNRK